jgi:hypothetical protein
MTPEERASVIREEHRRILRALPLAPKSPLPADYTRGWWEALNLCLDVIEPDRPRAVLTKARR